MTSQVWHEKPTFLIRYEKLTLLYESRALAQIPLGESTRPAAEFEIVKAHHWRSVLKIEVDMLDVTC